MPTPNHPALPLCCQLAAQPDRYLFASKLINLIDANSQDGRQMSAARLAGMLAAYLETDVISADQYRAMANELHTFAFGATA